MAEKYYRIPVAKGLIKLSAIEYITPVVTYSENSYGFRIIYTNYTSVPLNPKNPLSNNFTNTENTGGIRVIPDSQLADGYNCSLSGSDKAKLEEYRNDLINALTENGVNLIDNFPNE